MEHEEFPRLKDTVAFFPMKNGLFHVYDSATSRHFKLGGQEVSWLKKLDGTISKQQLYGHIIPIEYFQAFFEQLAKMNLVQHLSTKNRFNPLKMKLRIINPDGVLTRYILGCQIFSVMLFMAAPFMVVGNLALAVYWVRAIAASNIVAHIGMSYVIGFYCFAILFGMLHELGHAMVAKAEGVHVPAIGIMIFLFYPAMYADVSGIGLLSDRTRRIKVLVAGVLTNNLILALGFCVFVLSAGEATRYWASIVIAVNITFSLYNLIPFVQFDGYYILQELFEERRIIEVSYRAMLTRQRLNLENLLFVLLSNLFVTSIVILLAAALRNWLLGWVGAIWADLAGLLLFAGTMALTVRQRLREAGVR